MKSILAILLSLFLANGIFAQDKLPLLDKSPLDISYCPSNYPINKASGNFNEPLVARIIYSRPAINGRKIFGELVEYGKVWRLGANEATEIEFYKDVMIGGKKLKKGRYTIYAIPVEKKWTIIINKETDTWGAFTYDAKKDIMRIDVPIENIADTVEVFTIYFEKATKSSYSLNAIWENSKLSLPFTLAIK